MGIHIVMVGNPVDGFRFFGPFKTWEHANDFAAQGIDSEWWIVKLEAPEAFS